MRLMAAVLVLTFACIAGCAKVNVRSASSEASSQTVQGSATDNRSAAELRRDNRQLREQLAKLESDHGKWRRAVDARKDRKNQLENRLDEIEEDD